MILKYKVPKAERKMYRNKKVLYCKISRSIPLVNKKICYLVRIINIDNVTAIFTSDTLKKLNFIEKIVLRRKNGK